MANSAQPIKNESGPQTNSENTSPTFIIQRLYVKDLSFETPNTPQLFREPWNPNVNLELNVNSQKLEDIIYEVVLQLTVTVKTNDKVAFLAEIQQAGIFSMQGLNPQQLHHSIGSYCPGILFPYAREMISSLVNRSGFPPLYLAPINFDAVYAQQLQQQQNQKQDSTTS